MSIELDSAGKRAKRLVENEFVEGRLRIPEDRWDFHDTLDFENACESCMAGFKYVWNDAPAEAEIDALHDGPMTVAGLAKARSGARSAAVMPN